MGRVKVKMSATVRVGGRANEPHSLAFIWICFSLFVVIVVDVVVVVAGPPPPPRASRRPDNLRPPVDVRQPFGWPSGRLMGDTRISWRRLAPARAGRRLAQKVDRAKKCTRAGWRLTCVLSRGRVVLHALRTCCPANYEPYEPDKWRRRRPVGAHLSVCGGANRGRQATADELASCRPLQAAGQLVEVATT